VSLRNKKHVKAVLLYAKGTMRGLKDEDCIWNGGNILPIEIDGDENECFNIARSIFQDRSIISKYNLTLANSANIGRLLPQTFFYTYAFTRLKEITNGDIFYALDAGNYGNLTAGLYSWKFCLPVNGFITDSTPQLHLDVQGNCCVQDSIIPLNKRGIADPITPSNIERLEEVFTTNSAVIKGFVFPADVSLQDRQIAVKDAFMKYNILIDSKTAGALSAVKKRSDITNDGDETIVLISRDHPAFDSDFIKHCTGETVSLPESLKEFTIPVDPKVKCSATKESVIALLSEYLS
jgi:threonine synthase